MFGLTYICFVRDVWKKVAWGLTNDSSLPQYERAIYAALCGNLQQLRLKRPSLFCPELPTRNSNKINLWRTFADLEKKVIKN